MISGKLLDVEEVRRAQVLVAIRLAGVDRRHLHRPIDPAIGEVLVHLQRALELRRGCRAPSRSAMCFTENVTLECAASTFQVPVGMMGVVRVSPPVAIGDLLRLGDYRVLNRTPGTRDTATTVVASP